MATRGSAFEAVHQLVRRIPRGRVMTYGQLSLLLNRRLSPAAVGWALHNCPDNVPWQRVVNAAGRCSTDRLPSTPDGLQRALLEAEGVAFDADGSIDLARYRHTPRRAVAAPGTRKRRPTRTRRAQNDAGRP